MSTPKVEILNGGKMVKVGKSCFNALETAKKTSIWIEYSEGRTVYGQFQSNDLTALEYSIYEWIQKCERAYGMEKMIALVPVFDGMRYLMLALHLDAFELVH
jgi:hypothetical protein